MGAAMLFVFSLACFGSFCLSAGPRSLSTWLRLSAQLMNILSFVFPVGFSALAGGAAAAGMIATVSIGWKKQTQRKEK
jgi:hypothetical protein